MNIKLKYCVFALTGLIILVLGAAALAAPSAKAAGATYYVDCSAGSNGSGTQASPWNNLVTVNGTTFAAGDQILFKRGATCVGQLWPKGSGVSGSPITVSAYGSGAQPVIDGNNAVAPVVTIKDQNYWTFDNLEIKNSTGVGLYVDGTVGADLYGFTLTNLNVHNVGLGDGDYAVLAGQFQGHSVHGVLIDNVVTYNAFRGIGSGGKCCNIPASRSTDFTVRNSTVYDVQSDGILIASVTNSLVENNVAYNTGIMTTLINHTPNGIWTWDCDSCFVQSNEAYLNHSPGNDGGGFDIDYFSHSNTYQYNYGHDNDNYCISVFGGDRGDTTTNSTVRYNICANNAREGLEKKNDEIVVAVWSGGNIADTYIYNNTSYWNPANPLTTAFVVENAWHGSSITNTNIYNNIIYSSTGPRLVRVSDYMTVTHLDNNLYWYTGTGTPAFTWGRAVYTSFSAWQAGSGQDAHGLFANPMVNDPTYHAVGMPVNSFTLQAGSPAINAGADLVALGKVSSMGTRDFFGNSIPQGGAYDIGAYESGGGPLPPTKTPTPTNVPTVTNTPGGPTPTFTNTPVPPTPTNTSTPLPGGTNLALNKPVTAYKQSSSYPVTNAVDGNIATVYRAGKDTSRTFNWIRVDLQASYGISQVVIKGDPNIGRYATAYQIQVSQDDTNWTTVYSTTSGVWPVATINISPTAARYVRFYSTAWTNTGEGDYIAEFEVY